MPTTDYYVYHHWLDGHSQFEDLSFERGMMNPWARPFQPWPAKPRGNFGFKYQDRYRTNVWADNRQKSRCIAAKGRWDLQYADKFSLLRDKDGLKQESQAEGWRKLGDSDSEGLSDAESSTSKTSELGDKPIWLPPNGVRNVPLPSWVYDVPSISTDVLQALSIEVPKFARWAELREYEVSERQEVQAQLQSIVLQIWPSAVVELFGSSACGLALPSSDLDVVITNIEDYSPSYPLPHLNKLAQQLHASGITELSIIPHAKVPIVKYCHPKARVWVDVGFSVLNSTKCIPLVKGYLETYPLMRPMAILIKTLLRQGGLHKPHDGGLGSYAVVLLLVSFLRLRLGINEDIHNPSLLGSLVVDFLRYFTYHGTEHAFTPGKEDHPIDFSRPVNGRLEVWDPLDAGNNVAYSCRRAEQIQAYFRAALCRLAHADPRGRVLGTIVYFEDPNLRMEVLGGPSTSPGARGATSPAVSPRHSSPQSISHPAAAADPHGQEPVPLTAKMGTHLGSALEEALLQELQDQQGEAAPSA